MIGKPKELWQSRKSLRLPNTTVTSYFIAIEESNILTHDTCSTLNIFKNFFSNLAGLFWLDFRNLLISKTLNQ